MFTYELVREQYLPLGLEEAFEFFRDPRNLGRITPPWMNFQFKGEVPDEIVEGTRLDYRIRLFGVPMGWRTNISHWDPPYDFVDQQEQGPYAYWHHLHSLDPIGDGVLMRDRVRYRPPLMPLSRPVHALFIRPVLERVFNYRHEAVAKMFGALPLRA